VRLTLHARKSAIKKSNFFANTKQNSKRLYLVRESEVLPVGLFDEKNRRLKISWHLPVNKNLRASLKVEFLMQY
jgi:hypothetical protein